MDENNITMYVIVVLGFVPQVFSNQFRFYFYSEEKEETQQPPKVEPPTHSALNRSTSNTPQLLAPTAVPEVDEDGYCIKPKEPQWESLAEKKGQLNFILLLQYATIILTENVYYLISILQKDFIRIQIVIRIMMNESVRST